MPIYLLIIIIIVGTFGVTSLGCGCQKKFNRKLFCLNQLIPAGASTIFLTITLYYTKYGTVNMNKVFIPLVFVGILAVISIINGYKNTNFVYGTFILCVTLLGIFIASTILYGIGKGVMFVVPAIGVFLAFQTILHRKKR
nr:hypothetical protein [uncultured Cetobacterium sp.]